MPNQTLDELVRQYRAQKANTQSATVVEPNTIEVPVVPVERVKSLADLVSERRAAADPTEPVLPSNVPTSGESFAYQVSQRLAPAMRTGQFAGGTVGGLLAPLILSKMIPGPIDDIALLATGVLGAATGGGAGEAIQQKMSPYENINYRKMGEAAVAEGLGELGGRGISGGMSFIGRKLISKNSIKQFASSVMNKGIDATDAGNKLYQTVGRRVDTPAGHTQGSLHRELDDFFGPAYAMIGTATKNGGVRIESLKRTASKALSDHYAGSRILPEGAIKELEKVLAADDVVPFEWLRGHKTHWQSVNAQLKRDAQVSNTALIDLAGEAKRLQTDPSTWIGIDPKVAPELRRLNKMYGDTEELMDSVFPRRWTEALKSKPEKVVDLIGNPSEKTSRGVWAQQIKNTKKALLYMPDGTKRVGGQESWDNIRNAWWTGQINKYASGGDFDTVGFSKMLNLLGKTAPSELFDPHELRRVQDLQRLLKSKNARILNQNAAVLGTIGIAGGVGAGLGWDMYHDIQSGDYVGVMKDGTIAMSAGIIASAARSGKYASLVNIILRSKPRTPTVIPAVVRLVRLLESDRMATQKKMQAELDMGLKRMNPEVSNRLGYESGIPAKTKDFWGYGGGKF